MGSKINAHLRMNTVARWPKSTGSGRQLGDVTLVWASAAQLVLISVCLKSGFIHTSFIFTFKKSRLCFLLSAVVCSSHCYRLLQTLTWSSDLQDMKWPELTAVCVWTSKWKLNFDSSRTSTWAHKQKTYLTSQTSIDHNLIIFYLKLSNCSGDQRPQRKRWNWSSDLNV